MGNNLDLVGIRYDKLLVVELVEITKSGKLWLCLCDCGNTVIRLTTTLRRIKGNSRTGCKMCENKTRKEARVLDGTTRHGFHGERLYVVWKCIRKRCSDMNNKYYGGKGIKLCDEWNDYAEFRKWSLLSGYRDDILDNGRNKQCTIDRIDSNKDYCPDNCRWVTASENSRNICLSTSNN